MRKFGLIGFPLSHSFSKKYFSEKFEREGLIECQFENFPIASLSEFKNILQQHPDLEGLGVTIPYKESIISFLDEVSDMVKKVRACNCIKIRKGKLIGFNTDVAGFESSLKTVLRPGQKNALILGTGGASKAVEYVLKQFNIACRYVSRKPSSQNLSYEQITPEVIAETNIIINTSPLGMYPGVVEAPDIPYYAITQNHLLFDLIYNPEKTLFLKKGEAKGALIKNGIEMLKIQAEENWKIWNT